MPVRNIILITLLTIIQSGFALVCLQCSGISQPRHCRLVSTCDQGEVCAVEKLTTLEGQNLYNVGCVSEQRCHANNTNTIDSCLSCCQSDLCNAEGCGEPGYPVNMGPICYNCPFHSNPDSCRAIDFCEPQMVCKYDFWREFGDLVYSGHCVDKHICTHDTLDAGTLVGRALNQERSLNQHVCHGCCDTNLCNKQCDAILSQDICKNRPCTHGTCVAERNGNFSCSCNHGYMGRTCDIIDFCSSNPCVYGSCQQTMGGYTCQCHTGYKGRKCNETDLCEHSPCGENGTCLSFGGGFTCVCKNGTYGSRCELTDHCFSNPCVHGECFSSKNNYMCHCTQGYQGRNCDLDYCVNSPCNYGSCVANITGFTCTCQAGYGGATCSEVNATDCLDIYRQDPAAADGVYRIRLWKSNTVIQVICAMSSDGSGWTVFQNRFDGSVDFYRYLTDYTNGFGNIFGEYWLGLKYIKEMAGQGMTTIRMEVTAADGTSAYEEWPDFSLGDAPGYRLHVGGNGNGTAVTCRQSHVVVISPLSGESTVLEIATIYKHTCRDKNNFFSSTSNNKDFTAKGTSCGDEDQGGWWYDNCSWINLNGPYKTPGSIETHRVHDGPFVYFSFKGHESLKESKMMLRRK